MNRQHENSKSNKVIILFGDSLTQLGYGGGAVDADDNNDHGSCNNNRNDNHNRNSKASKYTIGWISLLSSTYARRAAVLNRGYRGYNTNMALSILPSVFPSPSPSKLLLLFVTIWFGANDAVLPTFQGKPNPRHVPVEKYGENITTIIRHIRKSYDDGGGGENNDDDDDAHTVKILVLTPPPVDPIKYMTHCIQTYGHNEDSLARAQRSNTFVKLYVEQVKQVANESKCDVVDVYTLLEGHTNDPSIYTKYLVDGVHLTQEANILVYEHLMKLLNTKYPTLAPPNGVHVPFQEKEWNEYFQ